MKIDEHHKIFAIQEAFNTLFPYLKLEFFHGNHLAADKPVRTLIKPGHKTLHECRTKYGKGSINIIPDMTVTDLEKYFDKIYGIGVQVLRKSGKIWLETTLTDKWTLEEQNKQGKELSS